MSAAATPAVAPASTGEVTTAPRAPASIGRAEVLAPPPPRSSARPAAATSRLLWRRPSNVRYGKPARSTAAFAPVVRKRRSRPCGSAGGARGPDLDSLVLQLRLSEPSG